MRRIIDGFNDLHIAIRIGLIALVLVGIGFLAVQFIGGGSTDDIAPDDVNEDVASDTSESAYLDETTPGTETVDPEDEMVSDPDDDMGDFNSELPEDAYDQEAEEAYEQDESLDESESLPGEASEDDMTIPEDSESSVMGETSSDDSGDLLAEEDSDTSGQGSTEKAASDIKSEQSDEIQAIWDDLKWAPVTLKSVTDPYNIQLELIDVTDPNSQSFDTMGTGQIYMSLVSVDVPSEMTDKATARINEFLGDADTIVVEAEPEANNDSRGYIHADFVNLQYVLLEEGLATVSDADGDTKYIEHMKEYEQSAKDDKLGVWAD